MRYEVAFITRRHVQVEADTELEAVELAYGELPDGDWLLPDDFHEVWGGRYDERKHGFVIRKVGD